MLMLTRKRGESIMIGDTIKVTVTNIKGNQVHIGVAAPKDVEVHREEVYQRLQQERAGVGEELLDRGDQD